jgi:hypothetical protein
LEIKDQQKKQQGLEITIKKLQIGFGITKRVCIFAAA